MVVVESVGVYGDRLLLCRYSPQRKDSLCMAFVMILMGKVVNGVAGNVLHSCASVRV